MLSILSNASTVQREWQAGPVLVHGESFERKRELPLPGGERSARGVCKF